MANNSKEIDPTSEAKSAFYYSAAKFFNLIRGLLVIQILLAFIFTFGSCFLLLWLSGYIAEWIFRLGLYKH